MIVTFGNTVSSTTTKIEEQLFKANLLNQYMVRKKRQAVEDLGAERQKSLKIEQKFETYSHHYKVYKWCLRVWKVFREVFELKQIIIVFELLTGSNRPLLTIMDNNVLVTIDERNITKLFNDNGSLINHINKLKSQSIVE